MSSTTAPAFGSTTARRHINQSPVSVHGDSSDSSPVHAAAAAADSIGANSRTLNPLAREFVPGDEAPSSAPKNPTAADQEHAKPDRNSGVKVASVETSGQQSGQQVSHTSTGGGLAAALKNSYEQGKRIGHEQSSSSSSRRGQGWNANHLLNFHYDRHDRQSTQRAPPRKTQLKPQAYDKELFLQANFRFLVSDMGDYMENTTDPDKMLEWEDIALVELSSTVPVQCPICLDSPPLCPQITSCGHVFCFPCILRYLLSGQDENKRDHWKKCPLCFTMTSSKELRTVYIHKVKQYNVGDEISLTLLTRAKNSVIPFQSHEASSSPAYSRDGRCHLYSKFTLTSDIKEITNNAISELTAFAEKAKDTEELGLLPYVFAAIDQLKKRKAYWDDHRTMEFISSSPPVRQRIMAQAKAGYTKLPGVEVANDPIKAANDPVKGAKDPVKQVWIPKQEKTGSTYQINPFTDEKEPIHYNTQKTLHQAEDVPDEWESLLSSVPVKHGAVATSPPIKQEDTDFYSFYQASDGQLIILHPISMKCLVHHYGSYKSLPSSLQGKILELENVVQTEASRRRHRYLSHLPLTSSFQLCEIDVFEILPKASLAPFSEELHSRENRRRRRSKEEKKLKSAEEKAAEKQVPPSPEDFIVIMQALQEDEVPTNDPFADVGVQSPSVVAPPVEERKLFSRVTQLGFAAGHDAPDLLNVSSDSPPNRPSKPSPWKPTSEAGPSGAMSFADVIQREKDKNPEGTGKNSKGKKPTRVLLSTSGGRRY